MLASSYIMATIENPISSITAGSTTGAVADEGDSSSTSRRMKRKMKMRKMERKTNLMVTFSKRRSSLFKKASEMSTLCGVQLAIIVFSPGQKAFSFGYPNVDVIINRYLRQAAPNTVQQQQQQVYNKDVKIVELSEELTELEAALKTEKGRGRILDRIRKQVHKTDNWWESPVEEMNMKQLTQMMTALEFVKNEAVTELRRSVEVDDHQDLKGSSSLKSFVP